MSSDLMTSTIKSDAGTPAGFAEIWGASVSAAATAADGRNADGREAFSLRGGGAAFALTGDAFAAPARATPARNLRRSILDRAIAASIACRQCCRKQQGQSNVKAEAIGALPVSCSAHRRQRRRRYSGRAAALSTDLARVRDVGGCRSRLRAGVGDVLGRPAGQDDHTCANLNAAVKILYVIVEKANAARGYERANRRRLVGTVNSIERIAEIKRAGAKRITGTPRHHARQIRLTLDHLRGREPVRPFFHPGDAFRAGPRESLAADTDPVAHCLAAAEHEVEIRIGGIDDDRAGRFLGREVDELL